MVRKSPGRKGRSKRVTIRDVARAAGVSVGAASTALSDRPTNVGLSKETRKRVVKAARELRYRPHAAARAMAGRSFRTIGVLATEWCLAGSFYSHVLRGIVAQAGQLKYRLLLKLVPTTLDMRSADIFTEAHIDGVIIPADVEPRTRDALQHFDIPHVWLNTELEEPQRCVHQDEIQGVGLAIDYLVALGHRRIAYVPHNVPDRHYSTIMRERGYLEGLHRHGVEPMATYERHGDIAEHVDTYLALRPRPTALLVYSDAMAILACNALVARGLQIPEDMSVVGNEAVVLHRFAYRTLTSVRAPVLELGRAAVRLLVQELETGQPAPSVMLPQELEINESTGPPPRKE